MNKKLATTLLAILGVITLMGAGYLRWEYKKLSNSVLVPQIPFGANTETVKEKEPSPQEESLALIKDQILNHNFSYNKDYIWHLPEPKEGESMKFTNGIFENLDSYIYKAEIDKDHVYIGNIDNQGVSDDVVLKINSEYYATDDTYQIYPVLAVGSIKDDHLEFLAETLLPRSIVDMNVVYFKPGEIVLDFTKTTGLPPVWPEKTYRFRYKFIDHKLVLQDVPNMDRDISFLSPKAGDVWKIGEIKQIVLNKPVPYETDCWNNIALMPKEGYSKFGYVILLDESGNETFLNRERSSYNWDTKTTTIAYCGVDKFLEEHYGTRDEQKESVPPGTYRFVIYANDTVYGKGADYPPIYSDYFTIAK